MRTSPPPAVTVTRPTDNPRVRTDKIAYPNVQKGEQAHPDGLNYTIVNPLNRRVAATPATTRIMEAPPTSLILILCGI